MMEELREKIIKDINESKLSVECVYYLVKDLFREIEGQYVNYIQIQKQQKVVEEQKNAKQSNLHILKKPEDLNKEEVPQEEQKGE